MSVSVSQLYLDKLNQAQSVRAQKLQEVQALVRQDFSAELSNAMQSAKSLTSPSASTQMPSSGTSTDSGLNMGSMASMMAQMMQMQMLSGLTSGSSSGSSGGSGMESMSMLMMMQLLQTMQSTTQAQAASSTSSSVASASLLSPGSSTAYDDLIAEASAKYGVGQSLIKGLIQAESSFNASATAASGSGASGLMQLMPGTAASLGVTDMFSPAQNIDGGVRYLKQQLDTFGGDVKLALAAYNCGPDRLQKLGITSSSDAAQYGRISEKVRGYVEYVLTCANDFAASA